MELLFSRKFFQFPLNKTVAVNSNSWVRTPAWDIFWFHSGIWLTLLMLLVNSLPVQEMFYAAAVFLFWISHRFSSFYLAWGTRAYRPLCRKQLNRFVILPVLLGLAVFAVLFIPEDMLPVPLPERILCLLLIDFAWGVHHFAAQHYGILRLYHHRWNPESVPSAKKQDRIFCWGVGGALVIIAELLHGTSYLQEKQILTMLLPNWGLEEISLLQRFGTLFVIGITIFMIRNAWLQDSGLPRIMYILGVGLMVVAAFQLDPFQFLMLWTLQHWMVALGLAAHMGGNDVHQGYKNRTVFVKKSSEKPFLKPWLVLLFLCAFSVIMTPIFEIEAVSVGGRYSEQFFPAFMGWLQNSEWYTFLVGIGLASGFLHYWMDRSVYRFSDLETRKSAQQLLFAL